MPFEKLQDQMNFLKAELRSDLRSCATVSVIAVSLLVLSGCSTPRREPNAPTGSKSTVVYAIKDIPENKEITLDAMEQREIEQSKIPAAAIYKTNEALGKLCSYGVSEGQIICTHDLVKPGSRDTVIIDIKKGYGRKLDKIADKKRAKTIDLATKWLNERIEQESGK
jgi:hypothetical protein